MTIEQISFHSTHDGPHFVVFGAVHGNEYCGPEAIRRAITSLQTGKIELKCGKVTFIPIANPNAYEQKTRFVERNLNRHFYPKEHKTCYEDFLDPLLCGILDDADILLDLHSYQSLGGPFCFLGTSSQAEIDYSRALGIDTFIYGWADAFGKDASDEQKRASIGTTDYTRRNRKHGIAVTVECGHHHNDNNADIGYEAIMRALDHFEMASSGLPIAPLSGQRCIQMQTVFYKEKAGALVKPWKHADKVSKGEIIAKYEDGDAIKAPEDGVLVLPKASTDHAVGSEWFYFGVETDFPAPSPLSD